MYKKLALAVVLLPITSVAFAGDVNPGGDNPGTSYITEDFTIGAVFSDDDACMEVSSFCTEYFVSPAPEDLKGKKRAEAANAMAEEFAEVACVAAADANAETAWFYEGSGDLVIARHGNHGAVHRIRLEADLATATLTAVDASAMAGASAAASAYAFAEASSVAEACDDILAVGDPDPVVVEFCANAAAAAEAEALAQAAAAALADSSSAAASGAFGAASIYNEVWAANIEQYMTALVTGAGSFAEAEAEASAAAMAAAYAEAFAEAYAQACAGEGAQDLAICGNDASDDATAYAEAYALAYAEAQAEALAYVEIEVGTPVMYKNENGIEDTIVFGPNATTTYDNAYVNVSCNVPEDPDAEG